MLPDIALDNFIKAIYADVMADVEKEFQDARARGRGWIFQAGDCMIVLLVRSHARSLCVSDVCDN